MYESRHQAPIARASFVQRLLRHLFAALGLLLASLAIGMLGYVVFEHLSWIDAFLNAAMLLGGMGPVNPPRPLPENYSPDSTHSMRAWYSSFR